MDKNLTLEAIKNAKKAHEEQMQKIDAAINGKEIQDPTSLSKTKCVFGMWLYDNNNHVKEILGSQFFTIIDKYHTQWHTEYAKIFNILFEDKKKGFFSKMIGSSKVDSMELDRAKLYYTELQVTTNELLKILASSERRLEAMNESKFF